MSLPSFAREVAALVKPGRAVTFAFGDEPQEDIPTRSLVVVTYDPAGDVFGPAATTGQGTMKAYASEQEGVLVTFAGAASKAGATFADDGERVKDLVRAYVVAVHRVASGRRQKVDNFRGRFVALGAEDGGQVGARYELTFTRHLAVQDVPPTSVDGTDNELAVAMTVNATRDGVTVEANCEPPPAP